MIIYPFACSQNDPLILQPNTRDSSNTSLQTSYGFLIVLFFFLLSVTYRLIPIRRPCDLVIHHYTTTRVKIALNMFQKYFNRTLNGIFYILCSTKRYIINVFYRYNNIPALLRYSLKNFKHRFDYININTY